MDHGRRHYLRLAGAMAAATLLPRRGLAAPPDLTGRTMGTFYRIRIADAVPRDDLPVIRRDIDNALSGADRRLSLYRPDSELSRLNAMPAGVPAPVSNETLGLLRDALVIQSHSDGAFSPFTAPLVSRWGFGPAGRSQGDVASHDDAGYDVRDAGLLFSDRGVARSSAGVGLDLNAIAKGDAVDRILALLADHGLTNCLVEIGGEVACSGLQDGAPWRVGIQGPGGDIISRIHLDNAAVATSGDHIHYYLLNGRRYSHLMDPGSGRPLEHDLALVSVVARDARRADAWSTALMVLGPARARILAHRRRIAALLVERRDGGWRISRTPAYRALEGMPS